MTPRLGTTAMLLVMALAPAASHAQVAQQGRSVAEVRRATDDVWARVISAAKNGNAPALSALYADDALIIDPSMANVAGRANIRQVFTDMLATTMFVDMTRTPESYETSGDLAVETGVFDQTWQARNKPQAHTLGRYTVIFKNVNGDWLILRDVTTPVASPATAPR